MSVALLRHISVGVRLALIASLTVVFALVQGDRAAAAGAANDHTVLILGPTVTGGASSLEAQAAIAAGMDVEVVDAVGWAAKSAADFRTYRALILGDPTCVTGTSTITAAIANASVWGSAVNGRVILIGTDPVFHNAVGVPGGGALTRGGVTFVVGEPGNTGAYIALSCYYHGTAPHTPVPVLNGLGSFTMTGVGCFNDAHIVATHPALSAVTDAALSGWSCSVHEAFDTWPIAGFQVLAIARNIGSAFTASDGTVGTPYILARGVTVISDITLTPGTGTQTTGSSYTLTATVREGGTPTAGRAVTFRAIAGPNLGQTGTATTNASGQATFTYTSTLSGSDTWVASFVDSLTRTQTSGTATVDWTVPSVTLHSLAVNGTTGQALATGTKLSLSGDWTVEAWFKDENPLGYNHDWAKIVAKADGDVDPEGDYSIAIGYGSITAGARHNWTWSAVRFDLIAGEVSAGAWHHVAATLSSGTRTLTLYLDGSQVAQGTLAALSSGNALPVAIGGEGSTGHFWTGKIDDVRVWNVVRSAADIAANRSAEFSVAPLGLVANWKFDESTGTTAADSTSSPANATLTSGATFSADVH